jgi:hypothetical protein
MIVIGDVTVLSQSLESGLIVATVMPISEPQTRRKRLCGFG